MKKKGTVKNILMVIVCVLTIVINAIAPWGREALDGFYGTYAVKTDKAQMEKYLEAGENAAFDVQAEGTVLVQNNGVLPLNTETKNVNIFGWASTNWLASGSGSAQTIGIETDLLEAFEKAGFSYNKDLAKMYEKFMSSKPHPFSRKLFCASLCLLVK